METKTECKVFFITDFSQQADYLSEMHQQGWKLVKISWLFFYHFEKCQPEEVVYQVDFKESKNKDRENYLHMYEDYGWEFVISCQNFVIFRKVAVKGDLEIYGDRESKVEFVKTIFQRRYLPSLGLYGILLGTSLGSRPSFVLGISIIYIPLLLLLGLRFYRLVKNN
ncbi:TPA: DUF2812 domain-containing protein [Streptococcus suis]|uniref:DUF2812 domain-containing protein n=1 Tax=Streptococcus TaxID=1301 RepID=UPI000CA2F81C|nr:MULTISPECIES: DUF2812 domain-containing protein [Streptococcus]AUC90758.1 hypothetical protein CWM22_01875 [Streptococcus suis]MCL4935093.1 DUF2812 domain-containing protein [Streptococcus suis]HEM2792535.1 DUF2812 domain-containing protein [Streptococcus suis]